MNIICFLLVFAWVSCCLTTATCRMKGVSLSFKEKDFFKNLEKSLDGEDVKRILAISVLTGLVTAMMWEKPDIGTAIFGLALMLGVIAYMDYWVYMDVENFKQLFPMGLAYITIGFTTMSAIGGIVDYLGKDNFWGSLIHTGGIIFVLGAAGLAIYFCISYKKEQAEANHDDHAANVQRVEAGVLAALMLFAAAFTSYAGVDWKALSDLMPSNDEAYADESGNGNGNGNGNSNNGADWAVFYNLELQDDGIDENDFNFGPVPSGKTPEELDEEFRARVKKDPALGSADMAWADAIVGTRYLGEFYQSCKKDWAKTINVSKESFINDEASYQKTYEAFFKFLDKAKVSVETASNLEDQMYQNPFTTDDVPDVIVLKTKNHKGSFLVYTFKIKGDTFKVAYRIECGFQPTNVQKVMGIKPQATPKNPGKGDNGKPKKPSKPGKGDDSKPRYNKDPSKAPKKNTEPNDDKGPGPNTNNPKDPNHSTEDTPDSSTSGSYDDYKKGVDEKKDINQNQKQGGDSSKPSTGGGGDAKQDNNGSKADKPTEVHDGTAKGQDNDGQVSEPD
ncbi:hypothetical protein IKF92_00095 [Candidatus Saccharibacteria bacterium]|nr:hypothetical protein [Candidatus Saccharibacteria bacterium]